jgi:hypothetical protein
MFAEEHKIPEHHPYSAGRESEGVFPRVFRLQLTVILPSSNHLLSRLLHATPDAAEHLERVDMVPGFWSASDTANDEGHVYFPESGLMGLFWPGTPSASMGMALLGCQACWWSGGVSPLQMQVLQAGQAQRIRWSVLQAQPQRFAPWLQQTAAASQQLLLHMTQMIFCVQNHTRLQRLASGLLRVQNQQLNGDAQMSVTELALWLACPQSEVQALAQALQTLQAQGAVQLMVDKGTGAKLHRLQPQVLARLACSCHRRLAQGQGASDAAAAATDFVQAGFVQVGDISARAKDSATLMPSTPADKMPPA